MDTDVQVKADFDVSPAVDLPHSAHDTADLIISWSSGGFG
jgi:hypothetical protein